MGVRTLIVCEYLNHPVMGEVKVPYDTGFIALGTQVGFCRCGEIKDYHRPRGIFIPVWGQDKYTLKFSFLYKVLSYS